MLGYTLATEVPLSTLVEQVEQGIKVGFEFGVILKVPNIR
jgi:hypothetical protein